MSVKDIGEVVANSIYNTCRNKRFLSVVEKLKAHGLKFSLDESSAKGKINGKLNGKNFLVTGKLSVSRKEIENLIKENGGNILSAVSKNLDYLIVGEDPGSKLDKAKKLNINIIGEKEFIEMIK
jgi:DNA ligase (NAD+)